MSSLSLGDFSGISVCSHGRGGRGRKGEVLQEEVSGQVALEGSCRLSRDLVLNATVREAVCITGF